MMLRSGARRRRQGRGPGPGPGSGAGRGRAEGPVGGVSCLPAAGHGKVAEPDSQIVFTRSQEAFNVLMDRRPSVEKGGGGASSHQLTTQQPNNPTTQHPPWQPLLL